MSGEIRVGRWMPFRARQISSPEGFVWAAEAGRFPMRVRGFTQDVAVRTSAAGRLESVVLERWGSPDGDAFAQRTFGVDMFGDVTFCGGVLPQRMEAGWHHGTDRWADGRFYRDTIDSAEFF